MYTNIKIEPVDITGAIQTHSEHEVDARCLRNHQFNCVDEAEYDDTKIKLEPDDPTEPIYSPAGVNPYECLICHERYAYQASLDVHMSIHLNNQSSKLQHLLYECDICQIKVIDIEAHKVCHIEKKLHQCNICNRVFNRNQNLTLHMQTHTGDKPFECDVCQKRFSQKTNLKVHFRTHTKEKPYECELCHVRYTMKHHLTAHMNRHAGKKPYECHICHKRYTLRSFLKSHILRHGGVKDVACNICHTRFDLKIDLTEHMLTHTDEMPYECNVCSERYNQKNDLETHKRTHAGRRRTRTAERIDDTSLSEQIVKICENIY